MKFKTTTRSRAKATRIFRYFCSSCNTQKIINPYSACDNSLQSYLDQFQCCNINGNILPAYLYVCCRCKFNNIVLPVILEVNQKILEKVRSQAEEDNNLYEMYGKDLKDFRTGNIGTCPEDIECSKCKHGHIIEPDRYCIFVVDEQTTLDMYLE